MSITTPNERKLGIAHGTMAETCPVRSLKTWLKAAGIVDGPVFRPVNNSQVVQAERLSDEAVVRAVKRGAERAGIDPDLYAGHSLRAGLATSAAAAGGQRARDHKPDRPQERGGGTALHPRGSLFRKNASAAVGL